MNFGMKNLLAKWNFWPDEFWNRETVRENFFRHEWKLEPGNCPRKLFSGRMEIGTAKLSAKTFFVIDGSDIIDVSRSRQIPQPGLRVLVAGYDQASFVPAILRGRRAFHRRQTVPSPAVIVRQIHVLEIT